MLSYNMFKLEKFYKEPFLSMQPKDLCINCEKINLIQTIVSIQINNKIKFGPICQNCYSSFKSNKK